MTPAAKSGPLKKLPTGPLVSVARIWIAQMPRRPVLAASLLPLALSGAAWGGPSPAPATVGVTTIAITGRGFGHGVGLAQWGTLGFARAGLAYDEILAHYYPGTTLGRAPATTLRILLTEAKAVVIGSASEFRIEDGAGGIHQLPAGRYRVGLDLAVSAGGRQGVPPLQGPLTVLRGESPVEVAGRPYRGSVQVQVVGNQLQAVNVVGLEAYLRGVVSEEMPEDWPLEAVKAQAVAARSYAVAERLKKRILYADVRSQVYGGIAAETEVGGLAVRQTKGQVLLYDGEVATTYFFSSSGGRTGSIADLDPAAKPVPYLVSVPDPYDTLSPYHTWGPVTFTAARVSKLLGVPGVTDLETRPATRRAREVIVSGSGESVTMPAVAVRRALGLRSTWFRAAFLSLSRSAGTVAPGSQVTLTGFVRRVKGVILEQRPVGGEWTAGPALTLDADGAFSVAVAPEVTSEYRLVAGELRSKPLRVPVG